MLGVVVVVVVVVVGCCAVVPHPALSLLECSLFLGCCWFGVS